MAAFRCGRTPPDDCFLVRGWSPVFPDGRGSPLLDLVQPESKERHIRDVRQRSLYVADLRRAGRDDRHSWSPLPDSARRAQAGSAGCAQDGPRGDLPRVRARRGGEGAYPRARIEAANCRAQQWPERGGMPSPWHERRLLTHVRSAPRAALGREATWKRSSTRPIVTTAQPCLTTLPPGRSSPCPVVP
jgi:hypothetical protein